MSLAELEDWMLNLLQPQRAALARLLIESLEPPTESQGDSPYVHEAIAEAVHARYLAHLSDPNPATHRHEDVLTQLQARLASKHPR